MRTIITRQSHHLEPLAPAKRLSKVSSPHMFFILWSGTFDSILAIVLRENRHHSPKPPSKQQQELTRSLARPQQLFQASFKVFLVKFDVNHNIIKLCPGLRLRRYWSDLQNNFIDVEVMSHSIKNMAKAPIFKTCQAYMPFSGQYTKGRLEVGLQIDTVFPHIRPPPLK